MFLKLKKKEMPPPPPPHPILFEIFSVELVSF